MNPTSSSIISTLYRLDDQLKGMLSKMIGDLFEDDLKRIEYVVIIN
jgi:hypothetical protein